MIKSSQHQTSCTAQGDDPTSTPRDRSNNFTSESNWRRVIRIAFVLIAVATLTTSCVPLLPQVVVIPVTIPFLLTGFVLFAASAEKPALRVEGLYLIFLCLLFAAGYLLAMVTWFHLIAAYIVTLTVALMSGLIIAGAAATFRKYGAAFIHPKFAALFGFLVFFLINFGYNVTLSQLEALSSGALTEAKSNIFGTMIWWGQLPYLSFLLAPVGVAVIWAFDSVIRKQSWNADRVIRINLWTLWAVLIALIAAGVIVKGNLLASPFLGAGQTQLGAVDRTMIESLYLELSDLRTVLFLTSFHDLLVIVCLTFGVIAMNATGRFYKFRNVIAVAGLALAVLLAYLPFYVGQEALLGNVVSTLGGNYAEQVKVRAEFLNIRGLYPSSIALKHLIVSLTAGGVIAFSVNLPSISIKLGK